jgi:hypothetical protein
MMKLVPPHGVSGILTKADVGDQIGIGNDGQSVLNPTVKHPLIVPCINPMLINLLKDIRPIADERWIAQKVSQPFLFLDFRPQNQVWVISFPGPPPRGPSPDVGISRKIVAVRRPLSSKLEIDSSDMPHSIVVSIFLQQLFAEFEKSGIWQTVVFENDGFLHLAESPVEAARHPLPATEVDV